MTTKTKKLKDKELAVEIFGKADDQPEIVNTDLDKLSKYAVSILDSLARHDRVGGSEKQKKSGYVQPGRVGKKAKSVYLSQEMAVDIDNVAKALNTDTHTLIVDLIARAIEDFGNPAKRANIIRDRVRRYEAELLKPSK